MRVNILTVTSGWILQKIAERIAQAGNELGHSFVITNVPDPYADVNFYVDYSNTWQGWKTNCDVGYLTHADRNDPADIANYFNRTNGWALDGMVSMNERYTKMLDQIGYANKKITIVPGQVADRFPLKKTKIGIVSRGGYPGYGHGFMLEFFRIYPSSDFTFMFLGSGWDDVIALGRQFKHSIEYYPNEDYSFYPEFYEKIDYLLIPGLWTAGPMCMEEALATGTPVIGADVGFVNYEFMPDYCFEPGNIDQLISILNEINEPKLERRKQVENLSWKSYAEQFIKFVEEIKNDRTN